MNPAHQGEREALSVGCALFSLLELFPVKFCPSSGHCGFRIWISIFVHSNTVIRFLVFFSL